MLEMIAAIQKEERECEPCKRHQLSDVASLWCKDCREAFCEDCDVKHSWWLKFKTHSVVPLKNIGIDTNGIDLNVISERCPQHSNKAMESFCYDHAQLCCISCITSNHRSCTKIEAIDDIIESTEIKSQLDSLREIKDEANKLLKTKMAELENVKSMVADSEECAEKMVKSLKLKLDQLFENLTKQIQAFRDEQEAEIQVRIRLLEQLVGCLEHGLTAAEVVKLSGSKTQLMMYLKTIETQLSSRIRELQKSIGNDRLLKIAFEKHEVLQKLDAIETMGTLAVAKAKVSSQMKQMLKLSSSFWWKVFPSFDALGIEKVKEVHKPGFNFRCGVCVDVGQMILGNVNGNKLHLFNNDSETISSSTSFRGDVKRLCYFPQHKRIFMSCYSHESFCASFDGKCIKEPFLLNSDEYVRGLQSFNGNMYIITDRKIKTFPLTVDPKYLTEMNECFETNTECGLNSLGIHDGELVYTTMDCEIKRTRFDGNKIYCYKNVAIKIPECIAVLPSGMVLVVDRAEKGSLHLLSEDGKRSRVLLDKFESIEDPQDIWMVKHFM